MNESLFKRFSRAILLILSITRVQGQEQPCSSPVNYSDFSIVSINSRIYLTGGTPTNLDIWSLDLSHGLNTTECLPWQPPSDNVARPSQFQPYLYGVGFRTTNDSLYVVAGDSTSTQMSQLCEYDMAAPTKGTSPSPRAEMTAAQNDQLIHFYGGRMTQTQRQSGQEVYFNDFYSFNIETMTWDWPQVRYIWGQRPARFGHTANIIMDRMFVLGGKTAVINSTDSTWVLHPADFQSVLVYDTVGYRGVSMLTVGDIPAARLRFSAVAAPDGKSIVVFGGQNASSDIFDATQDVYVLNTCTLSWSKPATSGVAPAARAGHEAIAYGKYMLVMMGYTGYTAESGPTYTNDVAALDMTTWTWVSNVAPQGALPRADPGCRFEFPNMPNGDSNVDGDPDGGSLPYDPTVVSNPNTGSGPNSKALGVGLGLTGFLLCLLGLGCYAYRCRRKSTSTQHTTWLSSVFSEPTSKKKDDKDGQPRAPPPAVTKANVYPMSVYSSQGEKMQDTAATEQSSTQKQGFWSRFRRLPSSVVHNPSKSYWKLDET